MDLYPGLRRGEKGAKIDFVGDDIFGARVHFFALHAARAGQPVYLYEFVRTPPSPEQTAGAYHAAELPFVHGKNLPLFDFTEEDEALAWVMGDYWAQFAKSGDPNLSAHPEWPVFTPENQRQMQLGIGDELGAPEIDRLAKYELLQRRLLRLTDDMKRLRQGETQAVPA